MKKTQAQTIIPNDSIVEIVNKLFSDMSSDEKASFSESYKAIIINKIITNETPKQIIERADSTQVSHLEKQLAGIISLYNIENLPKEQAVRDAANYFNRCANDPKTRKEVADAIAFFESNGNMGNLYDVVQEANKQSITKHRSDKSTFIKATSGFKSSEQKIKRLADSGPTREKMQQVQKRATAADSRKDSMQSRYTLEDVAGTDSLFSRNFMVLMPYDEILLKQFVGAGYRGGREAEYFETNAKRMINEKNIEEEIVNYRRLMQWHIMHQNNDKAKEVYEKIRTIIQENPGKDFTIFDRHIQDQRKDADIVSGVSQEALDEMLARYPKYNSLSYEEKVHLKNQAFLRTQGQQTATSSPSPILDEICGTDYEFLKNMLAITYNGISSLRQSFLSDQREYQKNIDGTTQTDENAREYLSMRLANINNESTANAAKLYFTLFNWSLLQNDASKAREYFHKGWELMKDNPNMGIGISTNRFQSPYEVVSYFANNENNLEKLLEKYPVYLRMDKGALIDEMRKKDSEKSEMSESQSEYNPKPYMQQKRENTSKLKKWLVIGGTIVAVGLGIGLSAAYCNRQPEQIPSKPPIVAPVTGTPSKPAVPITITPTQAIPVQPVLPVSSDLERTLGSYGDTIWNESELYVTEVLGYPYLRVVNEYTTIVLSHNNMTPEQARHLDVGTSLKFPKIFLSTFEGKFRIHIDYNNNNIPTEYTFYEEQLGQ